MDFRVGLYYLRKKGIKKESRCSVSQLTGESWPIEKVPDAASLTFVVHHKTKF